MLKINEPLDKANFNIRTIENVVCEPHINKSAELVLILSGNVIITLQNKHYFLKSGEGILIFPYEIHDFKTENESLSNVIMFNPQLTKEYFDFGSTIIKGRTFKISNELLSWIKNASKSENDRNDYLFSQAILTPIFLEIEKNSLLLKFENNSLLFSKVLITIDSDIVNYSTLTSIAKKLGCHPASISRLFPQYLSVTFKEYVNTRRINKASWLLINSKLSITEIAYETGFGSIRNFNRVYANFTGITPSQVRKNAEYKIRNV